MARTLLETVRKELACLGDPVKAPKMQAYMKSAMPYHGVPAPILKKACRTLFDGMEWDSPKSWQADVLGLWRAAKFREERYAAIHLSAHRLAAPFQSPAVLSTYEEMIVTGAWWDYVDDIAIHRVGPILGEYPGAMTKKMLVWSRSKDMWKKRTSIICQIMLKDRTDLKLLYACIAPSMASDDFFLRKGIGWALRQVAWRDPDEVIRYVKKYRDELSSLSKREALKNVLKSGRIEGIP